MGGSKVAQAGQRQHSTAERRPITPLSEEPRPDHHLLTLLLRCSEQLTAFELWLEHGGPDKKPPEQLPIVLQASAPACALVMCPLPCFKQSVKHRAAGKATELAGLGWPSLLGSRAPT